MFYSLKSIHFTFNLKKNHTSLAHGENEQNRLCKENKCVNKTENAVKKNFATADAIY